MKTQKIRKIYISALFTIALVLSVGHLVIYNSLNNQKSDGGLLNIVGRQRMLSQYLAKNALLLSVPNMKNDATLINQIESDLKSFCLVHEGLKLEKDVLNLHTSGTKMTREAMNNIDSTFTLLKVQLLEFIELYKNPEQNKSRLIELAYSINSLSEAFLTKAEKMVLTYQWKVNGSLERNRNLGLFLLMTTLLIIFAEGFFLFRPTIDKLDEATDKMKEVNENIKSKNDLLTNINLQLSQKEDELNKQNHELIKLNHQLSDSHLLLTKSNKELEQFAYIVSHDMKAPLRAIRNLTEWIEEDLGSEPDPSIIKNFTLLKSRVDRMESLINGILAYSRATRQNINEPERNFEPMKLINESIENLSKQTKNISFTGQFHALKGNPIKFIQVATNLIDNAFKYNNSENAQLIIQAYPAENGFQKIEFMDNGPGILPEFREKVFEIFQTLNARDKIESTGVGLTIVKKIVEENNGKCWIEGNGFEGSSFYITWPVA
jgi:signal transduction histidine kinase